MSSNQRHQQKEIKSVWSIPNSGLIRPPSIIMAATWSIICFTYVTRTTHHSGEDKMWQNSTITAWMRRRMFSSARNNPRGSLWKTMSKLPTTVSTCTDLSDLAPPAKVLVVFETNCVASGGDHWDNQRLSKHTSRSGAPQNWRSSLLPIAKSAPITHG